MKSDLELNSLAVDLRKDWEIDAYGPLDIFSIVLSKFSKLSILIYPMSKNTSGLCINEENIPIIGINSNHSKGRQKFTLAHELYHLLFEDINDIIICNDDKNDSEVESLISEMDKIVAAVADFKENCTNTKLVQELNPWLSSLNDVATGIKAILKSAQGSSTVAITTTAGIVAPLLPVLGLDSPARACLTVIAIGAGAMTVSHANDSYFWVVTNFGEMTPQDGYKTQTLGTLVIGVVSIIGVFIVSLFLH